MRKVMHLVELLFSRLFFPGKLELGMQLDPGNRHLAVFIFLHVSDRIIDIFVEEKLLFAGDREEREHAGPLRLEPAAAGKEHGKSERDNGAGQPEAMEQGPLRMQGADGMPQVRRAEGSE